MNVCRVELVSITKRRRDHKAPFIIFAIALKFQDLYFFALLTMFFISGIDPRSSAFQANALPSEPPGKPEMA